MRRRASGPYSVHWQEEQKRGGLGMMDAKPERAVLTSCVCLPGATWAGFPPSSDKERDPCFSQHLCTVQLPPLPGNKLVWCVNKGGSHPSNMAGEPPGLHLKTSHPQTGPKFPLILQMQAHSHREWMNPARKCCQSGQNQGERKKKKKRAYHPQFVNWFTNLDSLEWPRPCPPGTDNQVRKTENNWIDTHYTWGDSEQRPDWSEKIRARLPRRVQPAVGQQQGDQNILVRFSEGRIYMER